MQARNRNKVGLAPAFGFALERLSEFVAAGAKLGHQKQFYAAASGILGSEEFVDEMIHRIGDFDARAAAIRRNVSHETPNAIDYDRLLRVVEAVCGMPRGDFYGPAKGARSVFAKEAWILSGRELGAGIVSLSRTIGLSAASTSRRADAARRKIETDDELKAVRDRIVAQYTRNAD